MTFQRHYITYTSEPLRDKSRDSGFARSKDSDQPGHSLNLTRVFVVRLWFYFLHAESEEAKQTE